MTPRDGDGERPNLELKAFAQREHSKFPVLLITMLAAAVIIGFLLLAGSPD